MERLVIDMLYLQARSVAEVQKLTGWSAATIKIRAFRARQKLRKHIGGLVMKKSDRILDRLFRAAAGPTPTSEMPFGFDTRVLALARESSPNGSAIIALFAQRAAMIALAIIALAQREFTAPQFLTTICPRNMRWRTTPSKAVSANEQFFAMEIDSRFRVGVSRRRRLRIFRGHPCAPAFSREWIRGRWRNI